MSRLRHPSILGTSSQRLISVLLTRYRKEMVEPLEETRSELIFATEPILSSLDMSILRGSHHTPLVELDEIEVSDGTLATPPQYVYLHPDPKGHPSAMQGTLVLTFIGKINTLKLKTRMRYY